ncbi:MAG: energy transducer TonB [Bacteroidota bacterium]
MSILENKYKRKSAIITAIIAVLIVVLIFNFGLKYFDPPIEYGISVNFGTTDFGSGNVQPNEALKPMDQEADAVEEEIVEEIIEKAVVEDEINEVTNETSEDIATQNNEEAIAIKKQEDAKRKAEAEEKARVEKARIEKERIEREKKEAIAKEKREQEAKKQKLDALMGGLNTKGKATGGEGDDNKPGDKGKVTGDPNASGYYGVGGSGSGGNYRLGNRKALTKPKPTYDCNEEGNVYVEISVDKNGNVIAARTGVKGTTNSAPCLLQRAKEAALKTKFNPDSNAPAKQVGLIIYNFSLSE